MANRTDHTITAKAVDGPFAYLDSKWTFEAEGEGTRIRFDIDFKISNPLMAAVAEPAFAAKQDEIMDAFVDEADRALSATTDRLRTSFSASITEAMADLVARPRSGRSSS